MDLNVSLCHKSDYDQDRGAFQDMRILNRTEFSGVIAFAHLKVHDWHCYLLYMSCV